MNIITEKKNIGRVQDGISTILKLDDTSFGKVLERLNPNKPRMEDIRFFYTNDNCEAPSHPIQLGLEQEVDDNLKTIMRGYYCSDRRLLISELFEMLDKLKKAFPEGRPEIEKIDRLLATRDLDAYKMFFSTTNPNIDYKVIDKAFEVLSDEELFQKFLNYSDNKQDFEIDGVEDLKKEISKCICEMFGAIGGSGRFVYGKELLEAFYTPDIEIYKQRVAEFYKTFNFHRYTDKRYEFQGPLCPYERIKKGDEPEFDLSPELREAIYKDMPEDLSIEEQIVHIYSRLCKDLSYNEEYNYNDKLDEPRYSYEFSKEHLESIKPGSKITCYDFSRIFAKCVNDIDGEVEAFILYAGENKGHFLVGVMTDQISAEFDAINIEKGGHSDDLMKAKAGIKLAGITSNFDEKEILRNAIKKIYPQAIGKPLTSMGSYLIDLRQMEQQPVEDNLELKLQTFVETLKKEEIVGNEFVQTFGAALASNYFGTPLQKAYVGKQNRDNGRQHFDRLILCRPRDYRLQMEMSDLFVIDTSALEFSKVPKTEIAEKLKTGEYVYEDEIHKLELE